MLFVCLAHFTNSYHFLLGKDDAGTWLVTIGMLASPTFVTVSGTVAGFLWTTRRNFFAHLQRRLLDRGVFLLSIGHIILALSGFFTNFGIVNALKRGYITDAIAIAVIIGPWLVTRLSVKSRLLVAATLFVVNWLAILFWAPHLGPAVFFKHYFVGIINPDEFGISFSAFPAIPWFAVYLVGTTIGQTVGKFYVTKDKRKGHALLAKIGVASFSIGVVAKLVAAAVRHYDPAFSVGHPDVMALLSSYQKFPPGPTYLFFFAGAGMLMASFVLEADRRGHARLVLGQLRQLGEASLFVYALQFYLYTVLLRSLHLRYTRLWPIGFIASLGLLALAATLWNSVNGKRFLTVGLTHFLERRVHHSRDQFVPRRDEAVTTAVQLPRPANIPLSHVS